MWATMGLLEPAVVMLAIAGGSGSGKSTFTRALTEALGPDRLCVLAFDSYYRDQSHLAPEDRALVNYDHPDALDVELFQEHLGLLRAGVAVAVPRYDFSTHSRLGSTDLVDPRPVVIAEGILVLSVPAQDLFDLRVFVDAPDEVRLGRRVERDVAERGRSPADVRRQWEATVQPMFTRFVSDGRAKADFVFDSQQPFDHPFDQPVNNGPSPVAVVVDHIERLLDR